jgi:hypothetical protein
MARYPKVFSRRFLSPAAILCFAWAVFCPADAGFALSRAELYQATAPAPDRSEAGQNDAFQTAMKTVLVRVTGRRSAEDDPALAPLIANARRYVQQYRGAADSQLWVSFDGPAIERWLTQNGQPLWGHERPSTFVLLAAQTGPQSGTVITADSTSELKAAIDATAAFRGVPLVWPSAADLQRNRLDYAAVSGGAPSTLVDTARRASGEGVLVGRANGTSAAANVRWTLLFEDRSSEFSGPLEGVNRAADLYAELFAASGNVSPVDIEVSGVADLRDYARAQNYLESLTFISHVSVAGLTGGNIRFRLTTRGGAESLRRALSLNGPLLPIAPGDAGLLRFELRH